MRKVGIMSMQRIANYGSFLQAYALKQLIEELSCKVEFVDYHVGAPVITENADSKNKFVRKVEKGLETFQYQAPFAHKLSFIRYKQTFSKKYMPLLGITDEMNYNPTLDCLVIGSDEVFNCIQKNSNVGYSLELFGKDNHAKRLLTYAASFGNTTLEKLEKYKKADEVGVLLKKFDAISVRDANSGAIVEQLTEKKPVYNLDPVLTYDYMNCCDKIPQLRVDEKYLILYAYAGRISNEEADWIAAYAKEQDALHAEITELEKAVTGYEQSRKSAEKFIALIDKYENFDTLTNTMLNEFVEKILVHERARKGSQDTTQEVEIYFNFVGRYIPPALQPVPLTPEEQEELRKKEERKDRLHQNYLRRKANGKQKEWEERYNAKRRAQVEAAKAAIRAEDMEKGVFIPVSQLPRQEPRKAALPASAAV